MKMTHDTTDFVDDDLANRDPITKEPGSHPVGTGLGAGAAGLAGAVVGTAVAGPIGGVVAATAGAAVGAALGHNAAEAANPTYLFAEPLLRERFVHRPYALGRPYEDFEDAYVFGTTEKHRAKKMWDDDVEAFLKERWENHSVPEGRTKLNWGQARPAVWDAWHIDPPPKR